MAFLFTGKMTVSEAPIILEEDHGIARLVLNSPPGNDMNRPFFKTLRYLVENVLGGLNVRGLILHGRGRHFSSGTNTDKLGDELVRQGADVSKAMLAEVTSTFRAMQHLGYPVVAAVRGCCLGSALELAIACHYRIAVRNAVFALPETTFGLMPGCGATVRLPDLIGQGKAIEMILSGRSISAADAATMGLIDMVVGKHELMESAHGLIDRLNPPTRVGGP